MSADVLARTARPRYQLFPDLTGPERSALRNDIAERGVLVPVEVDDEGVILDGHHRVAIADELGIDYPIQVRSGMTEAEKLEHVFALNIARRQLSGHDRTAVMAECKRRGMSLRATAEVVGVSHVTVLNDLRKAQVVSDLPAEVVAQDPDPIELPPPIEPGPTLQERAAAMRATGATMQVIADALGVSASTVGNLLRPKPARKTRLDTSAEWPMTQSLITELRSFAHSDPRRIASAVPDRNRASTARQLREVGTFLGSIALELERSER